MSTKKLILVLGLVALATLIFARPTHCGTDLRTTFLPVAEKWIAGQTQLYDAAGAGWFLPPWGLAIFVPLTLVPTHWAHGLLSVVSLAGIALSVHVLAGQYNRLGLAVAMFSMPTLALIISGNLDGLLCASLAIGWLAIEKRRPYLLAVALLLLSCKPVNVWPALLMFCWLARTWPAGAKLKVALPIIVVLALSFVMCGLDWPIRYWFSLGSAPPDVQAQISLWKILAYYDLPTWPSHILTATAFIATAIMLYRRPTREMLALSLCSWLAVSSYTLSHHLVLAAPALALLTKKHKLWALAAWSLALLPITRLAWGHAGLRPDVAYPALLALLLCVAMLREHTPGKSN